MTTNTRTLVQQARMNELSGKHAHSKLLKKPLFITKFSEILCIAIPIVYFLPSEIVTSYLGGQRVGAVLAVLLLIVSIVRHIFRWDDNLVGHRTYMAKNHRSASRALEILTDQNATEEEALEYLRGQSDSTIEEMSLFEGIPEKVQQYAYRMALKEFSPAQISYAICANCKKSVWSFKKGSCQLCGGNG